MNSEIEAKFLDIDHNEIRRKLADIGAQLDKPLRMMRFLATSWLPIEFNIHI